MTSLEWIANVAVVGLVVIGLVQLLVIRRSFGSLDRAEKDARFWRTQAEREARTVLQLRRVVLPDQPARTPIPIPNIQSRPAGPPAPMARPRTPEPTPIADSITAELSQVDAGEPVSKPIGSGGRRRRAAEATDA